MKDKHWSNSCASILNYCQFDSNKNNCTCYRDYLIWSKDKPKLDFQQWKNLILIERTDLTGDNR